jgi:AsmA protein
VVGLSEAEIRRSLNGSARFAFKDGAFKGANLAQIIRDASSKLGLGSSKFDTGTPGQTDFSELGGSFTMTNGVVKNQDLQAKSPLLRIDGKGEVSSLEGQGGKGRDELSGIPIPVRVTGPLSNPSYLPDLEAALSEKAKAQIEQKTQEVQKKAEDKVKQKLDGVLKRLFK